MHRSSPKMANEHMKRHSTPPIIKQMQVKTTAMPSYPQEWSKYKGQTASLGKEAGKLERALYIADTIERCSHFGKSSAVPERVKLLP